MLLGRRKDWIDRARYLATQARSPARHYEHEAIGYNYRLSNLLAAVGRAQLRDLERRVAARRATNAAYRAALGGLPGWTFMPEAAYGTCTFWLTCATVEDGPQPILERLDAANIEARPVWKPMHMQPVFRGARLIGGSVAERLFAKGLCLPSGSNLGEAGRCRVIDAVRGALHGA
jgi:pyridoxal phosphate-dependent aminotransferase EpsN